MSASEILAEPPGQSIVERVNAAVDAAAQFEIGTPGQAQAAVGFLSELAAVKKQNETARRYLVDPLNQHVKAINARFKENVAPLDEADHLVRGKLLAYQQQEQQRVQEQQAQIDEERRAREAALEAERRMQVEFAAVAECTARAEATQEACDRAETARREADEAQQREIVAVSAPMAVVTETVLSSASGTAHIRREWKATAIDRDNLPADYLIVDEARINREVKAGAREIPGVTIEQVDSLSVRAAR